MNKSDSMSFKARMKVLAMDLHLRPQAVIQNFMFERFLERLSISSYRDCFVIKGGLLISSIVGLHARSTMDIDATLLELPMTQRSVRHAVRKIAATVVADGMHMKVLGVGRIKEAEEGYSGIRVRMVAEFKGLEVPFSVDVTKGDAITPGVIEYGHKCQFSNGKTLSLLTYPVETIIAEKCEAILKRNVVGTRPRDYYDIYLLTKFGKIRKSVMRKALKATFENCGTARLLADRAAILNAISSSEVQRNYWSRYQREFSYACEIEFDEVVDAVRRILN